MDYIEEIGNELNQFFKEDIKEELRDQIEDKHFKINFSHVKWHITQKEISAYVKFLNQYVKNGYNTKHIITRTVLDSNTGGSLLGLMYKLKEITFLSTTNFPYTPWDNLKATKELIIHGHNDRVKDKINSSDFAYQRLSSNITVFSHIWRDKISFNHIDSCTKLRIDLNRIMSSDKVRSAFFHLNNTFENLKEVSLIFSLKEWIKDLEVMTKIFQEKDILLKFNFSDYQSKKSPYSTFNLESDTNLDILLINPTNEKMKRVHSKMFSGITWMENCQQFGEYLLIKEPQFLKFSKATFEEAKEDISNYGKIETISVVIKIDSSPLPSDPIINKNLKVYYRQLFINSSISKSFVETHSTLILNEDSDIDYILNTIDFLKENKIKTSFILNKIPTQDDLLTVSKIFELRLTHIVINSDYKRPDVMENAILPEVEANHFIQTLSKGLEGNTDLISFVVNDPKDPANEIIYKNDHYKEIYHGLRNNYCIDSIDFSSGIETNKEVDQIALKFLSQRTGTEITMNSTKIDLMKSRPIKFNNA